MASRRIVILGGGFGGVFTAKHLRSRAGSDVHVELISRNNFFVFQPLLSEVAGGSIQPADAVSPLRAFLPGVAVRVAEVRRIDVAAKSVHVTIGRGEEITTVPYDQLVIAVGQIVDLSRTPGLADRALVMKDVTDAFRIRNHVLQCLEEADALSDAVRRKRLLTFVVVGGGFTGVEVIGEMQDLIRASLKYYPNLRPDEIRIVLIQHGSRILPELPERLAEYAADALRRRGIEILLETGVKSASVRGVETDGGTLIDAETIIGAIGTAPSPLMRSLPVPLEHGKIVVDRCLKVQGLTDVWALGDNAHIPLGDPSGANVAYAPPLAQFAVREAKVLAQNILAHLRGETPKPFAYRSLGTMASLGARSGVADILGVRITGFFAWAAWRTFYLSLLPSMATRVRVAMDWFLDLIIRRNIAEIRVTLSLSRDIRLLAGDMVLEPGVDPGGLYVVTSGAFDREAPAASGEGTAATNTHPRPRRYLWPADQRRRRRGRGAGQRPRGFDGLFRRQERSEAPRDRHRSAGEAGPDDRRQATGERMTGKDDSESERLRQADAGEKPWRRWGPYLSERQWGTVREDYSADGDAWANLTHEAARSRAYRWGEDGLGGFCDDQQILCLGVALWNGKDPILKERLFGLTNAEGNHGEDVKEIYYYLDAVPTYGYARMLYKYPQAAYPYDRLVAENRQRGKQQPEFELIDTGLFDEDKYFDVDVEYAKADVDDILMRITVANRGPQAACVHVLPQVWFRNTWSWYENARKPSLKAVDAGTISVEHATLGSFTVHYDNPQDLLFCDNETNTPKLFGARGVRGCFKDAFHEYVVNGNESAVNSCQDRHQGRRCPYAGRAGRRVGGGSGPPVRRPTERRRLRRFRRGFPAADRRGRRPLRQPAEPHPGRRRPSGAAAGVRRHAVVEAVLLLRRQGMAGRGSGPSGAAAEPQVRPEQRLVPLLRRRHHHHAGQMGISLVRRMGLGLPPGDDGVDRSPLRQGPAHFAVPGLVHAPERAVAGVRVEFQRRQPAGACLGGLAHL